jgi:ribosome-associated protein
MSPEEKSCFIDEYMPIIDALMGKHALDVTFIDLRTVSGFADVFIIASARSDINARTLLEAVTDKLDEAGTGYKVEGAESARWKLIDTGSAVIHIFSKIGREFYKLERLWGDAPMTTFEDVD